jgi:hypothetical protein
MPVRSPPVRLFAHAMDKLSNSDLFDREDDATSLCVESPGPRAILDLEAWQAYCGFDRHGNHAQMEADFGPGTPLLTLSIAGNVPPGARIAKSCGEGQGAPPGPLALESWQSRGATKAKRRRCRRAAFLGNALI